MLEQKKSQENESFVVKLILPNHSKDDHIKKPQRAICNITNRKYDFPQWGLVPLYGGPEIVLWVPNVSQVVPNRFKSI